ncbi:hypothetical protein RclHR1_00150009 [Rhizophagus clarus]|uniref:BED-type domain-containing protein n=1 Tax=Rhizophagus clarus TaxID=94130 RepID=A0A2Z6QDZ7_9GLOM|nr:hypothetical protein RclHR1_00150009 [Rhizophagus clarus]
MDRNNKKRKEIDNNEHELNNIAEGSSAAAQRQNIDHPPVKKAKLKKNTTKTRTSWVWNYFEISDDNTEARCKVIEDDGMECGLKILYTGSTGNLIKHLARKHTLIKNSGSSVEYKGKFKQVKITTMVKSANHGTYSNRVQERYRQEVLDYILEDIQPISCELYDLIIKEAKSITFTADCWFSRSHHPYIGATATWCGSNFNIKVTFLSIEQFDHPHTSEKVKAKMEKYFRDWNLESKFITITC